MADEPEEKGLRGFLFGKSALAKAAKTGSSTKVDSKPDLAPVPKPDPDARAKADAGMAKIYKKTPKSPTKLSGGK